MRHAALGGGKRLRPFLLIHSAAMFGIATKDAIDAAAALECVHCYSLVHDDLPAMDDDALRRGRPTVHIAFDEATAILAGDALLTLAFDILATQAADLSPDIRVRLIAGLAQAAGVGGMAGGQMLDLSKLAGEPRQAITDMQRMKTGMLIAYACEAGAILGNGDETACRALREFGDAIGRGFQLADDLLDRTSNPSILGKQTGKDRERGKNTLVDVLGVEATRQECTHCLAEAKAALQPFGKPAQMLLAAARFAVERVY